MSLTQALGTALSGLQTNQKALDLVSRNIANVNTVGYTKKIHTQESRVLNGTGAGVQVSEVTRRVDYGLLQELNAETAELKGLAVRSEYFDRMQFTFGAPSDNTSIAHVMSDLAGEIEMLALDPEKTEQHMTVVQRADDVAKKLNSMGLELQDLRLTADQEIERTVGRINDLLYDINTLNEEIAYSIATAKDSTDLVDQRDKAVGELQSLINITTFTRDSGEVTVYTQKGDILVDREVKELSYSALAQYSAWTTKSGEDITPITVNGQDVTGDFSRGKLAALVEMRDSTLPDYQAQIDNLARELADTVNTVNNRGTSFPNLANEYVGTRTFLDSATQSIAFDADHDTVVVLFNSDGNQTAQTTLKELMNGAGGDLETLTTVDAVAAELDTWLKAQVGASASASVNSDGVLDIKLNSNDFGLQFKDVERLGGLANTDPSTWTTGDVSVSYDSDGDGANADSTHAGFSAFFGLNDVYTDGDRSDWAWDSGVKSESWRPFSAGTLNFSDSSGLIAGQLTLTGTETIQDIADAINADSTLNALVEAEVVPEGEGVRLRVKQLNATELVITQDGAGTGLINALGMKVSNAGVANSLAVKDEILSNPSLISRGAVLYNSDTSEYTVSAGDNSTANEMAEAFKASVSFEAAGSQVSTNRSLSDYAAMVLSLNASQANATESRLDYQVSLVDSLTLKNAEISSVNLDEEMAELIVYEQSYAASARVISTLSDLFDILNSIV
ncbi:flagellar hook-associated protein FlgK [Roseospira navarrensis]|uniref:Flagellar hook-associated protein 1 n=1 Tax=Roseospira navarrensis TaxID=140058 RepID=A0A7X2D1T3_9PROT|nr:flagellar hook-associated protein FlgK [Roseospira navarrensis]MQX35001.1 flagellar hook-associated protein FlgK [Roseospira navarrensis]